MPDFFSIITQGTEVRFGTITGEFDSYRLSQCDQNYLYRYASVDRTAQADHLRAVWHHDRLS